MPWPSTSPQQTILCVGDSITEGVGASTFHGRWLDLLQDDLRSANPTSGIGDGGGVAYLPAWRSSTVGNCPNCDDGNPTWAGGVSAGAPLPVTGMGYRSGIIDTGGTITYPAVTGDMIEVWYVEGHAIPDIDPLELSVDGGDPILVITDWNVGSRHDNAVLIDLGDSGPHELVFSRHAGGGGEAPILGGIRVFDGDGPTARYLSCSGSTGYYYTPDSAAVSVVGDVDLRARIRLDDYVTEQTVLAKWNSSLTDKRSYHLSIFGNKIRLVWSTDGTLAGSVTVDSSLISFNPGTDYWIRATLDVDNAGAYQVKFYLSTDATNDHDAVTWGAAISTTNGGSTTSIHDNDSWLTVGARVAGTPATCTGRIYAAAVLSGIGGTVAAEPRFDRGRFRVTDDTNTKWSRSVATGATLVSAGAKGIQMVDAAHAGAGTDYYVNGVTGSSLYYTDLADWSTTLSPDVIMIALGVNDWIDSITPATFKSNLEAIIGGLLEPDPSVPVFLIAWYQPDLSYGGAYGWADYVSAMEEIAADSTTTFLVDFSAPAAPAVSLGDGLHPDDDGHATIATYMLSVLSEFYGVTASTLPSRVVPTHVLGCSDRLEVYVLDRSSQRQVDVIPFTQVTWERVLDATSTASVTIGGANGRAGSSCCSLLADVHCWANEIAIHRNGSRIWAGPITDIKFDDDAATILAEDVSAWLGERRVHQNHTFRKTELTVIYKAIIDDAMSVDNVPGVQVRRSRTGLHGTRKIRTDQYRMADKELAELARDGIDWTTIDRTIYVGGANASYLPPPATIRDEHIASPPTVNEQGVVVTNFTVIGGGNEDDKATVWGTAKQSSRRIKRIYGIHEQVITEDRVKDAESATTAAQARIDAFEIPPVTFSGGQLSPDSPFPIEELVPGRAFSARLLDGCRVVTGDYFLTKVSGSHSATEDSVTIELQPVGGTEQ